MDIESVLAPQLGISIIYEPGMKRARKPINRSQAWIRPKVPTFKSSVRKMIHCESLAEEAYVHYLECHRFINDYCEQPALIKYLDDGKVRKHYPDILYLKSGSLTFVEIKKTINDITPEVSLRTEFLIKTLPKIGYLYELVVISEMDNSLISNSKLVYETARSRTKANYIPDILNYRDEFKWKEFSLSEQSSVAELILQGHLDINWLLPINANSTVYKVNAGESKWAC